LIFNQDGEGRPYGSWDVDNSNKVYWGSTNYNAASQPTALYMSNGSLIIGSEGFTYDSNTNRMTQWSSGAWNSGQGDNTQIGTLTWNANGTLQKLVISDTYNSSNGQTCTYGYDDLARVTKAYCDPRWHQDFAYDAWGNIWKAGNVNFQNGYDGANHVLGYSYDGMGNMTGDGTNTYSYDAEGRPISVAGKPVTYDAFNRAVEFNNGNGYRQVWDSSKYI
jgi:hypothetical protein